MLKQNQNYYTIKSEFYKNNNYKPITELEGKEVLTQNNFETYGIDDLNLLTKTIDTRVINGIDKGRLGSGKYFEVGLYNCCKRVKSQPVLDYTDNIMPQMNASTVNGITVTASSTEGNYYPYQAFDRNPSNAYAWSSNRYDSPEIRQSANLYINFNTLTRKVSKYKILSYYCYPYDIKLYGSNDNTDWKLLDERNNVVSEYKWYDFKFKNTINYQYYKFNFKTNEEKVFINEMELMELIIPFKYLIEYNSQLYTFNNTEIILSSSQVLDENNFINNGFVDATAITEEQWNTAFSDKSNLKLLIWTDDMSKTDVNIETETIPFRPIDKLKKNSDICNILFKEV
ncbi:discoidin domain-containing protein [Clostridium botulinum]|nr:discoidin domain-containing protein [Clostridium botulinum]